MIDRRWCLTALSLLLLAQPACFWRLWTKKKPIEERTLDVHGTVQTVTPTQLVIQTKQGVETFVFTPASIKGSAFGTGAKVHVYFKKKGQTNEITMAVEKIG
jgi:hypothetical protein